MANKVLCKFSCNIWIEEAPRSALKQISTFPIVTKYFQAQNYQNLISFIIVHKDVFTNSFIAITNNTSLNFSIHVFFVHM